MAHMRFAVLTSGGDAPGMNAGLRGVVREACFLGHHVLGAQRGYYGLLENDLKPLGPRDVSNILQRGGTFLHTSRCPEFRTPEGVKKAAVSRFSSTPQSFSNSFHCFPPACFVDNRISLIE